MISNRLKSLLKPTSRICVLTGAGVSQESGIPTFRDQDGLWQKFKPEELANMKAFLANPGLVWEWYEHRRKIVRDVKPNPGHLALVAMENFFESFTLVTQNVDGLHLRAGSKKVLEIHGNLMRSFCIDCKTFAREEDLNAPNPRGQPPVCSKCGGMLRPDVVWFGEILPQDLWREAEEAATNCDLFFSVGTSGAVFPAAGLALSAKDAGAYVVEVNPRPSEISDSMDEILQANSAVALAAIQKMIEELKK